MIIDFSKIEETVFSNFKGGEKYYEANMFTDKNNKIMKGRLVPGATIGAHTHETNSEVIYFLAGRGKVLYDGEYLDISEGLCHYCPQGHSHSLINDSNGDLIFFAVVGEH